MAIFQIIILGVVLIIFNSFIKKPKSLSIITSIVLGIIFAAQLSSIIITGEVADYKFYEHLNPNDIWSVKDFFATEGVIIVLSLIAAAFTIHYFSKKWRNTISNNKTSIAVLVLGFILLCISGGIVNNFYKTFKLKLSDTSGTFDDALLALNFDKSKYITPENIKASKGKNIIVLSLESYEKAYLSEKLKHLTTNLRKLSSAYSFYDMEQCPGATWTSASMYTTITGVPAFFGMDGNRIFQNTYKNKITTMSHVLKDAGYDLEYLIGNKEHSGINDMLTTLGFNVKSEKDFNEQYSKPPWGIHDKDLFREVKKALLIKKKSNKPFALFASTISTHFPNGLLDRRMEKILPAQKSKLEFMASAVDYFIGDLITFLEKEGMLSNTVFYIFPDHLLMGNKSRVIDDFNERKLFLITNSVPKIKDEKLYQIDLPKIILDGAKVKHNAKFLTDFITDKDKIKYVNSNMLNITRLNKSSLETINCIDGIYVELKDTTHVVIKNKDNRVIYSDNKFQPEFMHKIVFGPQMRVMFSKVVKSDNEFTIDDPKTTSIMLSVTNSLLYGQLKRGEFFGIAKKGDDELVFSKKDLDLLNEFNAISDKRIKKSFITIKSYSWNAKKKSSIKVIDKIKNLNRGLSIIKITSASKYNVKTFDTYGSIEETQDFISYLKEMQDFNGFYIVVGHDSMGVFLKEFSEELNDLGYKKLSSIKNRQAYIMYSDKGKIIETLDDIFVSKKLLLKNYINFGKVKPKKAATKVTKKFETDWFIAHAGGKIDNFTYTNSKNALDLNYKKGFRLFELDIIETKNGSFVAAHDWVNWSSQTGYKGELPPTINEFMAQEIRQKFKPLDMKSINRWFKRHHDAILITDKVNKPLEFAKKFVDRKRLRLELFTLSAVHEALKNNITPIVSEAALKEIKGDKLDYLKRNNIKYVAISRKSISRLKPLLLDLKKNNIKVYVYHISKYKDEFYVLENEIGIVYGMYADSWDFKN